MCYCEKKNKQVEEKILAKKKKMKMKYVQIQQQIKIIQDAIIIPKLNYRKWEKKRQ